MKLNVGKPVSGDELIGRDHEIENILKTLLAGQSIALIAPRRFGKTSIMLEVLQQLKNKGLYTGSIDIFTTPTIDQLAYEITGQVLKNRKLDESFYKLKNNLSELVRNIKLRNEIQDAEFILSFSKPEKNEWEQLRSSLNFVENFSKKHKKNSCFAFDEFGDINKLDGDEIVKLFRGIIQHQKNAVYIFSGSYESVMNQLFVSNKSPFYRMVKIIEPGYIVKEKAEAFIINKLEQLKIKYQLDIIKQGVSFTKGHPYYMRLFLQEYIFLVEDKKNKVVTQEVLDNMLTSEKNFIEKLWDEISSRKEHVYLITRIIELEGKPYSGIESKKFNLTRAIKELKGKGIITSNENGYGLTDPLFEMYIKQFVLKLNR